jgi:hypothetical protein
MLKAFTSPLLHFRNEAKGTLNKVVRELGNISVRTTSVTTNTYPTERNRRYIGNVMERRCN